MRNKINGTKSPSELTRQIEPLLEKYRESCLWYLQDDFIPTNENDIYFILEALENHGDREAFIEAGKIRTWLSQNFSVPS